MSTSPPCPGNPDLYKQQDRNGDESMEQLEEVSLLDDPNKTPCKRQKLSNAEPGSTSTRRSLAADGSNWCTIQTGKTAIKKYHNGKKISQSAYQMLQLKVFEFMQNYCLRMIGMLEGDKKTLQLLHARMLDQSDPFYQMLIQIKR